ncbi:pyridoxal-phosphate dependent enzyme [Salinithrix halophila]|uniref:Pyridoxal-phosphate dependent enzyme n=1 Tax=Salinithrix halophila TaxID=1485204 RepID=A0ABV8JID1_9BACL
MSFTDVLRAKERLDGISHNTPIITSRTLNSRAGCEVFLKCENLQRGGAFKFRGAYHTISRLSTEEKERGVIAFSSGNHAQAVALASSLLKVPAVLCIPKDAPRIKVEATREYGAEIVFYDRFSEDREKVATRLAEERKLTLIPPYNHPHIMAGAGTAALELLREVPDLDTVITPVGGGGLLSGTCIAAKGVSSGIRLFGIEPADANDTKQSLTAGKRVSIPAPRTIADGLRNTMPGELTFPIIQHYVESLLTVTEEEILEALRFSLFRLKLVVEPSGTVPLAALLFRRVPNTIRRIGVIISGGNIDPKTLAKLH